MKVNTEFLNFLPFESRIHTSEGELEQVMLLEIDRLTGIAKGLTVPGQNLLKRLC